MRQQPTTTDELFRNFVAAATVIVAITAIAFGVMLLRGVL
jgi:hypothetical protein